MMYLHYLYRIITLMTRLIYILSCEFYLKNKKVMINKVPSSYKEYLVGTNNCIY